MELNADILAQLEVPFDPEVIDWRPGATTRDKDKAMALGYVNARHYMDRLNKVIGGEWSDDYEINTLPDRIFMSCHLTICGVTRTDVGEELLMTTKWNYQEKHQDIVESENALTTATAQAFKRACTKFGLGSFFYLLPQWWAEYDDGKRRFSERGLTFLNSNLRSWISTNYPDTLSEMTLEEALTFETPKHTPFGDCTVDQLEVIITNTDVNSGAGRAAKLLFDFLYEKGVASDASYNSVAGGA